MDAPATQPAPAPPLVDAYEAYWHCLDEPLDAEPVDADSDAVLDAYEAYQALSDG